MGDSRSSMSKEDLTQRISKSVDNLERLIDHLCTIWIGRFWLQANPVRFQRASRVSNAQPKKGNEGLANNSFASVLKSNNFKPPVPSDSSPAIVLDDSCILENDLSCSVMGKIKDINALSNLYAIISIEGFDNVKPSYLGGFWVLIDTGSTSAKEKLIKHVRVSSWFSELYHANNSFVSEVRLVWILVEGLLMCAWNINAFSKIGSPWGTLSDVDDVVDASLPYKKLCVVTKNHTVINDKFKIIIKGYVYWIRVKELEVWTLDFDNKFCDDSSSDEGLVGEEKYGTFQYQDMDHVSESSFMKEINESEIYDSDKATTKSDDLTFPLGFTPNDVKDKVEEDIANSVNQPDDNLQSSKEVIENLVDIGQTMRYNMERCMKNIEAIVGIQRDSQSLWGNFSFDFAVSPSVGFSGGILCVWDLDVFAKDNVTILDSFVVVPGDFNEVRSEQERFGTIFNDSGAKSFNHFISMAGLIDLPLEGLLSVFPSLSAVCLDRHLSDHRPIIMREAVVDYGPSHFCVFHSWFAKEGFDKLVEDSWKSLNLIDPNKITLLRKKFQALKALIKAWCKEDKHCTNAARFSIQSRLSVLDKLFDKGKSNDDLVTERTSLLKDLHNINARHSLDLAQKAKIRWSIEGDENSKYFHGIINMKRSQLAIRGVLVEGEWIDEPSKVKNEFLKHFSNRFAMPSDPNIKLDSYMFKQITSDQNVDLESEVTYEKIKRAVWDCGTNKSPGLDGLTFDFIRRYWKIISQDVVNAIREFFVSSKFPPGSNSSFITLIPKKQDVKVDFEKSFDSVRWDYLDGILNNFVFGVKWRGWIQRCLNSAMGSILVNDSPSSEFEFHKGLEQGDPLSPFLFILVMESLHLSFNNILNAGLFKGIRIDESLTLSHLYYADDAVFIGKWDKANVVNIVHMLKCFFLASGLKINIHKSKLMGIGISHEDVNAAANIIGCSTFSTPFNYLGVKVGMSCSRSKSWDEVLAKFSSRLLNWKVKTLSIGGRLTLIKSVWRFRSQGSSLWSRLIKALYGDHVSLDGTGSVSRPSLWNNIIRELGSLSLKGINLDSHMKKKVGNGAYTLFWEDSWITDSPLRQTYSWLYALENVKHVSIADKLSDVSLIDSFRRAPRGGPEEEQYLSLMDLVASVILSNSNDRWVWALDSAGEFTVKSARTFIDDSLLPTIGSPTRWVKVVPIKINIFAWKVCLDKPPTRLNVSLRGIDIPSIICPVCNSAGESCSHILFSCIMARLLLRKFARWLELEIPEFISYEDWLAWFISIRLSKGFKDVLEGVFYVM
ncbi:RNA-directed DNA polymerase, eukaryota [Tanacetum coccineum]